DSLLGTKVWYSIKCTLTWKTKVTKFKRLLFQLAPSTHRTGEIESGLLPTAQTADANMARGSLEYLQKRAMAGKQKQLPQVLAMLPTPRANKHTPQSRADFTANLAARIEMLPTPKATKQNSINSKPRDCIEDLVEKGATKGQTGTKTGLKLQPAFALWMMGYPEDWLDLEAGEM